METHYCVRPKRLLKANKIEGTNIWEVDTIEGGRVKLTEEEFREHFETGWSSYADTVEFRGEMYRKGLIHGILEMAAEIKSRAAHLQAIADKLRAQGLAADADKVALRANECRRWAGDAAINASVICQLAPAAPPAPSPGG